MARFGRNRPSAVVPLADLASAMGRRDAQVGALGRALVSVERLGVAIPETWVVVADVFRQAVQAVLPPGHEPSSLLRTIQRPLGVERAAHAREALFDAALETDVERELDRAFQTLSDGAPWGLAVRASAIVSDQGVARAAGLAATELAVFSREGLGHAIRRVWAAAATESTLHYLRARRIRDIALAVLIQPVIVVKESIVLVTDARMLEVPRDLRAVPRRLAIAVSGLSHRDVDLSTAQVASFADDGSIQASRPAAEERYLIVHEGSLSFIPVSTPSDLLPDARVRELAAVASKLDAGGPSVVELVVSDEDQLVVVDVQPAEHGGSPGTAAPGTLFGRAAVAEAPDGPLTPLSAHLLARPLLERARLALPGRGSRAAKAPHLLATVAGRAYLNLSLALDGDDAANPIARVELASGQWSRELAHEPAWRPSLARAGLRIAQIATEQRPLADDVKRFEREAEQERRWLAEMDLAILPDDALTTTLHEVADFLTRAYGLYARASASALGGHTLLASVLAGVDASRASWLAHAVSSGADVVTAKPAAAFCHVAAIARYDEPARAALLAHARTRDELPDGSLRRAIDQFLGAYGDRAISETELDTPRWVEDPAPILAMLRASLRSDAVDPDAAVARARVLADRQLASLEGGLSFFETRVVRDIVARQRELLRLRERCRERVARGLGLMRVVVLDVDRRIRRLDPTLERGAAMMMRLDELGLAVSKYREDLAPVVRARRAEFDEHRRTPSPAAVFRGVPHRRLPVRVSQVLYGLRTSAGVGEGRVVRLGARLQGIDRFSAGDVLVVSSLDLGLVPLFLHAGAIVAGLGTPFSSSAVVARDCGLPVVTGLFDAPFLLRDGERVRVDGDAGTVEPVGA